MLLAVAVAGCGDDDSDLPEFTGAEEDPAASASASPGGTPAVDPAGELPKEGKKLGDPKNAITVGRTIAGDAEKKAVQLAYLAFWAERAKALRLAKVDQAALEKVAGGIAAERVVFSVDELAEKKRHTEGGSTVNIQAVTVKGTKATLTDCFQDRSVDLDVKGKPVQVPNLGVIQFGAELTKAGSGWRVTDLRETKIKACRS